MAMPNKILCVLTACLLVFTYTSVAQDTLRILSFGDLFLGSWAVEAVDTNGMDYPFRGTMPVITTADLVMANLEGPLTDHSKIFVEKQYAFRAPPRMSQTLEAAGIQAVNLANNHILDFGFPGLEETLQTLSKNGILAFGAGRTFPEAFQPALITLKDTKIAIFGFSTVYPDEFWADSARGGTAFPYEEMVTKALRDARQSSDVIIVHIHWGAESREVPKAYQVELGRLIVDSGADMVFGHHAHVPLGVEIYKGAPIFYGLGNFAFGSYSDKAKGMAAEVSVAGGKVIAGRIIPLNVNNVEVEFSPTLLEGAPKSQFIQHMRVLSNSLNQRSVINADGMLILPQ
jgi:poly-gamma-glutamate capsule biosynthesis protein CapA/YwtB (metallophosphatase superfamily)